MKTLIITEELVAAAKAFLVRIEETKARHVRMGITDHPELLFEETLSKAIAGTTGSEPADLFCGDKAWVLSGTERTLFGGSAPPRKKVDGTAPDPAPSLAEGEARYRLEDVDDQKPLPTWAEGKAPVIPGITDRDAVLDDADNEKRIAELEAQLKSTLSIADTWWNWAVGLFGGKTDLDGNGMRKEIKAQLAQTQKPAVDDNWQLISLDALAEKWLDVDGNREYAARNLFSAMADFAIDVNDALQEAHGKLNTEKPAAPGGLPEVGESIMTCVCLMDWERRVVDGHKIDRGEEVFTVSGMKTMFRACDFDRIWRRIPPAQTIQEPAASPPGEVRTPNVTCLRRRWGTPFGVPKDGKLPEWEQEFLFAVEADIRANVERETAKDKARIAELTEQRDVARKSFAGCGPRLTELHANLDAALAEVERLKGAVARMCPADGMSDSQIWSALLDAAAGAPMMKTSETAGAKARELFTPVKAEPAKVEKRLLHVGEWVWWGEFITMKKRHAPIMVKVLCLREHSFRIDDGRPVHRLSDVSEGTWLRYDNEGKTWWWDSPAKDAK